jgi:hypothetical protein
MTVRNDGDQRLRLQVNVMAWDQNNQGEMVLNPTDDIIFYPNLLTLEPGRSTKSPGWCQWRCCSKRKILSHFRRGASFERQASIYWSANHYQG